MDWRLSFANHYLSVTVCCTLFVFFGCSEADEIYKICSVIGTPSKREWAQGLQLASAINYQFPQVHIALPCYEDI